MKIKSIILSLAVIMFAFTACDDTKKKEEEAAKMEQMKMEEAKAEQMKMEEEAEKMRKDMEANSIAGKAMANPNYSTLVSALKTANLAQTFMEKGEYTVFAPTNDAFNKVPKAKMDELMKPENEAKLQNLLKYHVVSGEWNAAALVKAINENKNKYSVTTLQGENLTFSLKGDKVMVKDAKGNIATVADADMDASNGIIHGIDTVLMPKN
ncbi:fasciclin domain-containing protein [Constantimarinum furrinae]|uniref:Fasciclin n=1 Tax=Constantimarinum furrinae TaxID=2562285 RepID=A0A7G8PVW0_9FLAO|nr:fasciclin domain-containing protein [Constantimarinum furrinae]QNJ98476.1 fasciclin [Constantimarinum furrinae]